MRRSRRPPPSASVLLARCVGTCRGKSKSVGALPVHGRLTLRHIPRRRPRAHRPPSTSSSPAPLKFERAGRQRGAWRARCQCRRGAGHCATYPSIQTARPGRKISAKAHRARQRRRTIPQRRGRAARHPDDQITSPKQRTGRLTLKARWSGGRRCGREGKMQNGEHTPATFIPARLTSCRQVCYASALARLWAGAGPESGSGAGCALAEWHGSPCPSPDLARWARVVCAARCDIVTLVLIHFISTENTRCSRKRALRARGVTGRPTSQIARSAPPPPSPAHRITADSTPRPDPRRLHALAHKTPRISLLARNTRCSPSAHSPASLHRPLQSALAPTRPPASSAPVGYSWRGPSASVLFPAPFQKQAQTRMGRRRQGRWVKRRRRCTVGVC